MPACQELNNLQEPVVGIKSRSYDLRTKYTITKHIR